MKRSNSDETYEADVVTVMEVFFYFILVVMIHKFTNFM